MRMRHAVPLLIMLTACSAEAEPGTTAQEGCRVLQRGRVLAGPLSESSGLAASRAQPGVLWTHNDSGGDPVVFAVRATGELIGATRLTGARNRDWEDIAIGPCGGRDCLYVADTGDNERRRDDVAIYRVPEPVAGAATARAERFPIRYPDGARDTEAIFVLPSGEVFLVTKGRGDRQTLYRYPGPLRAGTRVDLERVVDLGSRPEDELRQITSASASPSGRWVAIRRYKRLSIYSAATLVAGDVATTLEVDLTPVGEAQGEAVAIMDDGRIFLSSEGGFRDAPGSISVLQCDLPAG